MKHNWEYKSFGKLCEIVRGGSPRPIQDYITENADGLNWIKIGDVAQGSKYITSTKEKIKPEGLKKTRQVFKGDFILSNSMSFGRPYILKIDGCIHDGWLAIKGVENHFIPDFLYYYLSSPTTYTLFEKLVKGGVVSNLNSDLVKGIDVPVPPMAEQKQIVAELDALNETLAKCQELLATLDDLAQSLFYDTFGDPITNPKGWEKKTFKEIFSKIGSGATPKGGKQAYLGGNTFLIRSMNVHNTYFKYEELAKIDDEQANELKNVEVQPGDVLLNITGASVARCIIVPEDVFPARVNQHVAILRPIKEALINAYAHSSLTSFSFQQELILIAKGKNATREALPKATLENIQIPIPPLKLQKQFAKQIEAIEAEKKKVEATMSEVQTLLNSRMDYWFN